MPTPTIFAANRLGELTLDALSTYNAYFPVVAYRPGFQRTALAADFSRFVDDFPITFIDDTSFAEARNITEASIALAVCVDWTKDFFMGEEVPFPVYYTHPALLPRYRGYGAVTEQFVRGVCVGGVTMYANGQTIDGGDIIAAEEISITFTDMPEDYLAKAADAIARMILDVAEGRLPNEMTPQDERAAFSLPRRRRRDALIDFNRDAHSLYNHVRGYGRPYFGAYALMGEQEVTVWKASAEKWQGEYGEPGTVIDRGPFGVEVACGAGSLILNEVEIAGYTYSGDLIPFIVNDRFGP